MKTTAVVCAESISVECEDDIGGVNHLLGESVARG